MEKKEEVKHELKKIKMKSIEKDDRKKKKSQI